MGLRIQGDRIQVLSLGTGQPKTVSLSVTTAASTELNPTSDCVRIWATVDCFIRFGATGSVVATTSDHPITAKVPEVFQLDGGKFVAGIVASGTGTLFLSEMQ